MDISLTTTRTFSRKPLAVLGYLAALAAAMSFVAVVVAGMAFPAWLVVQIWLVGTGIALLRQVGKPQPED